MTSAETIFDRVLSGLAAASAGFALTDKLSRGFGVFRDGARARS